MREYQALLASACKKSKQAVRKDRTGTGTFSTFGERLVLDLRDGLPVVTTKLIHLPSVIHELVWFLSGSTNVHYLNEHQVTIWDRWADAQGELGPVYGAQWRNWKTMPGVGEGIDQIWGLVKGLQHRPYSRRHIVNAWNASYIPEEDAIPKTNPAKGKMALAPCHCFFQCYVDDMDMLQKLNTYVKRTGVRDPHTGQITVDAGVDESVLDYYMEREGIPNRFLDMQVYMRSCDIFLGLPFNIASYAILQEMLGAVLGMVPRLLIFTFGDLHLYSNHTDQAEEQLAREPYARPTLDIIGTVPELRRALLNPGDAYDIPKLIGIGNYRSHGKLAAPISV
jgi:thymidylate synthase